jgi:hypothetical protein
VGRRADLEPRISHSDGQTSRDAKLDEELDRWSAMPSTELIARLAEVRNYQIESGGLVYQFEVQILENSDEYVHISVTVDDGRLPFSICPLGKSFTKNKH